MRVSAQTTRGRRATSSVRRRRRGISPRRESALPLLFDEPGKRAVQRHRLSARTTLVHGRRRAHHFRRARHSGSSASSPPIASKFFDSGERDELRIDRHRAQAWPGEDSVTGIRLIGSIRSRRWPACSSHDTSAGDRRSRQVPNLVVDGMENSGTRSPAPRSLRRGTSQELANRSTRSNASPNMSSAGSRLTTTNAS